MSFFDKILSRDFSFFNDFYGSTKINFLFFQIKPLSEIVFTRLPSLRYTDMNEKETPRMLLIFTANAGSLNPKAKETVHF